MSFHSRMITKDDGKCLTVGDLRALVQSLETIPHNYHVLVSTNGELDVSEIQQGILEFGENTSDDGMGWVQLTLNEQAVSHD